MKPADAWKEHNCIPDEHYVQTLLAVGFYSYSFKLSYIFFFLHSNHFCANIQHNELEWEITARSLTHSTWDLSSKNPERRGWHPMTYKFSDATTKLIKSIKVLNESFGPILPTIFRLDFSLIYLELTLFGILY